MPTSYPTDLTDDQWALVFQVLGAAHKRGPRHGADLRRVIDALLYVAHTGCQWRYLPGDFVPWTRVWGQFRRWSHNGTLAHLQAGLHEHARLAAGRADAKPSMVIIDTQLARGSSHGGETFHDRGGPYGATKGAKRIIAVDITGLALCGRVVPASTTESQATELLVDDIMASGQGERLELVLVDRGTSQRKADAISTKHSIEVRRLFHKERPVDPVTGKGIFVPLPYAWRVEVAHGQLGRSRRLSKSFENSLESATAWLQLGCISLILNSL